MEHTHALCSCEENTNTCMIMRTQMHTLAWSTTHASMHFAVSHKAKQNVPHLIRPNALEGQAHTFFLEYRHVHVAWRRCVHKHTYQPGCNIHSAAWHDKKSHAGCHICKNTHTSQVSPCPPLPTRTPTHAGVEQQTTTCALPCVRQHTHQPGPGPPPVCTAG